MRENEKSLVHWWWKRMNKNKFLLVDPHSVFHGPPERIKVQDISLSTLYSNALTKAVDERLNVKSDSNWNAVSTKYVSNYGLLIMGNLLKSKGYRVDYVNGDYFSDSSTFYQKVLERREDYDVICMSATTPQFNEMKMLAKELKENNYRGLIVCGGPHLYFFKSNYESTPFDLMCVGHNIISSVEKIEELLDERIKCGNHSAIDTIIHYTQGYEDLAKDFTLIPKEHLKETLLYTYASYGCPNNCRYCVEHYFNPKVCFPTFDRTFEEIDFLISQANVKSIHLADSDFFLNTAYTEAFIEALKKKNISVCFTVNTSPAAICRGGTIDVIRKFYEVGLIELLIGVEYFSESVLKKMTKAYNISTFYKQLSILRQRCPKLLISFYSLVGLPGSNAETRRENLNWFKLFYNNKLVDFSFPKFFVPYPGTDVFEHPDEYDAQIVHTDWDKYHRWALPRPIIIKGCTDEDLLQEVLDLYAVYQKSD